SLPGRFGRCPKSGRFSLPGRFGRCPKSGRFSLPGRFGRCPKSGRFSLPGRFGRTNEPESPGPGLFDGRVPGRFRSGDGGCGTIPGRTAGRWRPGSGRVVGAVAPASGAPGRPPDPRLEPPNDGVTPGSAGCEPGRFDEPKPPRPWLLVTDGSS